MNYQEARNILDQKSTRTKDGAKYRKLANNTYLVDKIDYIAVVLHNTEIIKFYQDYFCLDSGGYRTLTTKERINRFSQINMFQESFVWYIGDTAYFDNIKIDYNGSILNETLTDVSNEIKGMNSRIKKFVNHAMKELLKGIPLPGAGDCWHCVLKTKEGETIGDSFNDYSHLISHLDENYVVPSLIYNAVVEAGYKIPMLIISGYQCNDMVDKGLMGGPGCFETSTKSALRRYLQKRLLAI